MSSTKSGRTLDTLEEFLQKARRRLSDENPDAYELADEEEYSPEEDLTEQDEDEADAWLKENDTAVSSSPGEDEDAYGETEPSYDEDEDEDEEEQEPELLQEEAPPKKAAVGPMVRRKTEPAQAAPAAPSVPPKAAVPPVAPPTAAPTRPSVPLTTTQQRERASAALEQIKASMGTPSAPAEPRAPKRVMVKPASAPTSYVPRGEMSEDELQPSREDLVAMREYTRPWEQRARDRGRLEARPDVNPLKHRSGRLVEARSLSHADRQKAYEEFTRSPEYQDADPITQMDMDAKFHADWHAKNPDHIKTGLQAHTEAHKKGSMAKELHARAKDEKIRHIAGGGAQPGAYSVEEGLQHIGGGREDEDSAPSGITQDRSASFAAGNQEFLQDYMKNYDKRSKNFSSAADLDSFDNETRADIDRVLGDHPALKDPAKKARVDAFVAKYHPLISKAAGRVVSKLGLSEQAKSGQIDYGLLHEAGMHALFQAVNDYDHDHHSKAKFATHLNRKMHGLMQTALKTQDEIPQEMRVGAKKFDQIKRATNAAPVKITDKHGNVRMVQPGAGLHQPATPIAPDAAAPPAVRRASHEIVASHPPEVQDRLKRVAAAKPMVRRAADVPKPPQRNWNVRNISLEDEGGEE